MSDTTVELGRFNGLTLDDPVLGALDENVLDGGITFQDVTEFVFGVSVTRGRNRDLNRTNAGSVGVQFRNESRAFDPAFPGSQYRRFTFPRLPVRVQTDGTPVFTGLIDDWDFTYELGGNSVASITGSDAFTLFARETVDTTGPEELSGARVDRVLDSVKIAWPQLDRDVETGNATLAADVVDGNALAYLQAVEESEAGLIFMDKQGRVAFRERLFQPAVDVPTFADGNNGIPYDVLAITYGTDLLANDVTVTSVEGTATAVDTTSRIVYGVTELSVDTLLASGSLQGLADFILFRYSKPEYRVESIGVNLDALTSTQREDVLGLELGDQANLVFNPGPGGAISVRNRIIGIEHDIQLDTHRVRFSLEALPFDFFILDDSVFGKLDNTDGVLGF
jgi:hypothetical protein